MKAPVILIQKDLLVVRLKGDWLLSHTTPSWRIQDPVAGFQRIVKEKRAKDIAMAVLDQRRSFPNAIVLATDNTGFPIERDQVDFPEDARFLVVDGQHRLWAQRYSTYIAEYACMIHLGLSEVEMAKLFLEINNTQKRVPPSLRWDLVRLIEPEEDPYGLAAVEIVYELVTDDDSPLYQRVDLTGEQGQIVLKQASLAPEIKSVIANGESGIGSESLDIQIEVFRRYFSAMRLVDPSAWASGVTPFQTNRIMRALIRLLPLIHVAEKKKARDVSIQTYADYLRKIQPETLEPEAIRALQGSAGITAIFETLRTQVFGD